MPTEAEIDQALHDLHNMPPSQRYLDMLAYYDKHGCYRPEDLRHFLGDPCECVIIGPTSTVEDHGNQAGQS